jgi:glycosyltransferase involved in cell wall biosynthesis
MKPLSEARVAIVHEWLVRYAGSEQVVNGMLRVFPQADLFALVHDPESMRGTPLEKVPVRTSFLQGLPRSAPNYQLYLPLMPLAVEQLDLRPYDLILSSSHAVAKGVLTHADQLHISYVYTPLRYAWDLYQDYLETSGMDRGLKTLLVRPALHYLRLWDAVAANRVDAYLTLSHYVAKRIWRTYRRPARVIYPPVNVNRYRPDLPREDFFVAVSRFAPYKRVDLIAEAFTRMGRPLVIIGDGPEFEKVRRIAGPNVKLLGHQSDEVVADYLQRARAFVFAAEEDFGIAPVEAQAAGCPVIAYGRGGAQETVIPGPAPGATGIFFEEQTLASLERAVETFELHEEEFRPEDCRKNAGRFDREQFRNDFESTIRELWESFRRGEMPD